MMRRIDMRVKKQRPPSKDAAAELIEELAKRSIILTLHRTGTIEISNYERLNATERKHIDALTDELVMHLRVGQQFASNQNRAPTPTTKVAARRVKGRDLMSVIEMGNGLTARCYGNGQPRKPSSITMQRFSMPAKKTAPCISVVKTADDGPRAA